MFGYHFLKLFSIIKKKRTRKTRRSHYVTCSIVAFIVITCLYPLNYQRYVQTPKFDHTLLLFSYFLILFFFIIIFYYGFFSSPILLLHISLFTHPLRTYPTQLTPLSLHFWDSSSPPIGFSFLLLSFLLLLLFL